MSKVVMICPTSSQPRYHKRATQLATFAGVKVFAFSRDYYEENEFPAEIPFIPLGRVRDGNYFGRIVRLGKALFRIRKNLGGRSNCLFYAMSLDCMLIARLCGIKEGYYEVGDLRCIERTGRFFVFLERMLLKRVRGLILTSQQFYGNYYRDMKPLSTMKVQVIENKVAPGLGPFRPRQKAISTDRIVIGLIGLLRYRRPIELLLDFVEKRSTRYVVECYGDGPLRELVESYTCENIRYRGSFQNPGDLPKIYTHIDLNYVVYDSASRNVLWAIPNKLFESAFFGVPLVCCHATAVGEKAVEWGIGGTVRIDTASIFDEEFGVIDREWIEVRSKRCFEIASGELLDDGEQVLRKMFGSGDSASEPLRP